jgi:protein-L-isoaspartate(D-aspartate) O-methyltransferase
MTARAYATDFNAARQAMVDSQLRPQGVNDPAVIAAMASVPRENFVPESQRPLAYADVSIPLGEGRALSAASVLGQLLTALAPDRGERALVVGDSSGYSAAVLSAMGVDVTTSERAKKGSSFDFILIDGAVETIPDSLIAQLRDGGRLGAGIIDKDGITRMATGRKIAGAFGLQTIGDASSPPLPGFERPRAFTF